MSEQTIYEGLSWINDPMERPLIIGTSDITPIRYVVTFSDGGMATLHIIFSKNEFIDFESGDEPFASLGLFADPDEAIRASEMHDFAFFQARAERQGKIPLFRGTQRSEPMAENTNADIPAPSIPLAPDGRPFHYSASFFEALKSANKQNANGTYALQITVDARDVPLWLLESPMGTRLLVGTLRAGFDDDPEGDAARKEISDIMKRAQMRPQEPEFQQWLASRYDHWGLIATAMNKNSDDVAEAAGETLRRLIGIPSRAEMKTSKDARDRFQKLDQEFYFDMARSQGHFIPPQRA